MKAVNDCGQEEFTTNDIAKVFSWSDRIIQEIGCHTDDWACGRHRNACSVPIRPAMLERVAG